MRKVEKLRATNIAKLHKISNPANIVKPRVHFLSETSNERTKKVNLPRSIKYDDTYHHTDYAAVRAECKLDTVSANTIADLVLNAFTAHQEDVEKRELNMKERADNRYKNAIVNVQMQKAKNLLILLRSYTHYRKSMNY